MKSLIILQPEKLPKKNSNPICRRVGKIHWGRDRLPTPVFLGFLCGSACKESACNAGDLGLTPGLGRSPGEGKGYSLQYSGLENSMDYSLWGYKEPDPTERLSFVLSGLILQRPSFLGFMVTDVSAQCCMF